MKLQDKVALVTGASRGIGRAVAIELAAQGADVAINYARHADEAAQVAGRVRELGRRAILCQADVGNRAEDERMMQDVLQAFGRLDILVSNAAFSIRKPFLDLEPEDVEKTWSVSLWGVFHTCQLAARQMVKQGAGGNIVVISSVHAGRPYLRSTSYNAAKAAVNQMAFTWAAELIQYGIRVNVVEPGWTDTPGERNYSTEEELREGGKLVPIGRLARPEEIAKGVAFLVSDQDASYIVGSSLRIDGGFVLVH